MNKYIVFLAPSAVGMLAALAMAATPVYAPIALAALAMTQGAWIVYALPTLLSK